MKRKKLTEPQIAALRLMKDRCDADYYDLAKVGARGATISWLVAHGLAKKLGSGLWNITLCGKVALDNGFVLLPEPTK